MTRRKLAAGNWKMNGVGASLSEVQDLAARHPNPLCDLLICPPATLLSRMAAVAGPIAMGGQDCHAAVSGAHTGDISAAMLCDGGASYVIVGHSERRTDHGETDAVIRAKAQAAQAAGLVAVICLGETEAQRRSGQALVVVGAQLAGSVPDGATPANTVIAYEPVWAIGTGLVPSEAEITEVHAHLRAELSARFGAIAADGMRLLYGGSVKPGNAATIFALPGVDGVLAGGASLKADDFSAIIAALEASA